MAQQVPRSKSREVNGYVKAVLALEAVKKKREARYDRFLRALDGRRDRLAVEMETRRGALSGGQHAEARWILDGIPTAAFKDGGVRYEVPGRKARSRSPMIAPQAAHLTQSRTARANIRASVPKTPGGILGALPELPEAT